MSVYGTVTIRSLLETFFSSLGFATSPYSLRGPVRSQHSRNYGFPCSSCLHPSIRVLAPPPYVHTLLRHPIDIQTQPWYGILTCFPSHTPLGLCLGPTNPGRINLAQETLGLRRTGFSPVLSLLVPTFSFPSRPALLTVCLHPTTERSPTAHENSRLHEPVVSVPRLSPVKFSAQRPSTSELLRTL